MDSVDSLVGSGEPPTTTRGVWVLVVAGTKPVFRYALLGRIHLSPFAEKPYLDSVSRVLLLSGIEATFVAASVGAAIVISRRLRLSIIIALPTAWVAGEFLRSVFPIGFPWALLGYALSRDLSIIQIAGVTGAYGVSWLIVFANAALFSLALSSERRNQRITIAISLVMCVLAVVGFGIFQLEGERRVVSDKILAVGIVQGGLPQTFHFKRESVPSAFSAYEAATDMLFAQSPRLSHLARERNRVPVSGRRVLPGLIES